MAKCIKCGKKGLFLKVNSAGVCKSCEELSVFEEKKNALTKEISVLEEHLSDKDRLYSKISEKAKAEAVASVQNEIDVKNSILQRLISEISDSESKLAESLETLKKSNSTVESNSNKVEKLKRVYKALNHVITNFDSEGSGPLNVDNIVNEYLFPTVEIPLNCFNVKQLKNLYTQNKKAIDDILKKYESRYTTKANIAIYRLMVIALEAELQNILYSISFGKLDTALTAVKKITAKYLSIAIDGNQNIASTVTKFISEIEYLFFEAVKIEYEYFVQKERIKEEQRALREQMKQEAEERRQLEQQQKQLDKEKLKYDTQIENAKEQLLSIGDDSEKAEQLNKRIAELEAQINEIEEKKEQITSLQHGKAGHVYIISNLGSFGDNVFKIGMTRRLDPIERVKELGDASVPFSFDVHSFIFSDDAVALENNLHNFFKDKRVNKINLRKEFFRISVDEIEKKVYELQPTAEFTRTMLASEYYQGFSVDSVPDFADFEGGTDADDADFSDADEIA
jgi:septal ring factor EnvC (AmiA/AmiB activator)